MSAGSVEPLWARTIFSPVPVRNAFEVTVERLSQSIRLGVLVEGDRLPSERALSEALGVSRVTLRDAIRALREAGLLESRRGRSGGTFVVAPTPAQPRSADAHDMPTQGELSDVLNLRRIVEPGAAALAAARTLTAADRTTLTRCLEDTTACEPATRRLADSRLHMAIAAASETPSLLTLMADVQMRLGELLREIPVLHVNIAHSDRQHAAIVSAILAGETERARLEMEEHVDATAALLRGLLTPIPAASRWHRLSTLEPGAVRGR